ncbi:MAG: lysophospholipase [Candidatus Omnitrophica bacterium]|nr:lysophospholipase [Candidatus Omnitrophota bacterium]
MWTEQRFISFDETPVFYRRFVPARPIKFRLFIVHGMGEHGGRYREVAEYLGERGGESWAMDLRGFGQSGGRRACLGHFIDYEKDLEALIGHALKTGKEAPSFLLGHSLGGLVASSYLGRPVPGRPALQGLVLSSPLFGIALPVPLWRHSLGMAFSYLLPGWTQDSAVNPSRLTHDEEAARNYPKDPFIFRRISLGLYREIILRMRQRKRIAENIRIPALLLQAGEDLIVSKEKTLLFYSELAAREKEIEVYGGFYHELLNETGRKAVFERLSEWIRRRIGDAR